MSDPILEKLDQEWLCCTIEKDYGALGKILRAYVNVCKGAGSLRDHKDKLGSWVKTLESALALVSLKDSFALIGHLRHARTALSISSSDVGSAFRGELSREERARWRKRNRAPRLSIPDRGELPAGYAIGAPSHDLQPDVLGNGKA